MTEERKGREEGRQWRWGKMKDGMSEEGVEREEWKGGRMIKYGHENKESGEERVEKAKRRRTDLKGKGKAVRSEEEKERK